MAELKHFFTILRIGPRGDVAVLLVCFLLTVLFDMVVGVSAGVVFAALIFIRRMSEATSGKFLIESHHEELKISLPPEIMLFEIAGPLFFGAARQAFAAMSQINDRIEAVIILMKDIPVMDITGFVACESMLRNLRSKKIRVCLVGVKAQPLKLLEQSELLHDKNNIFLCKDIRLALEALQKASQP